MSAQEGRSHCEAEIVHIERTLAGFGTLTASDLHDLASGHSPLSEGAYSDAMCIALRDGRIRALTDGLYTLGPNSRFRTTPPRA